jgi:large subunit ribosomal protein L22
MFRGSTQKVAELGRQLSGLPLDAALIQTQFSARKAAEKLHQALVQAKEAAKLRGHTPSEYVIKEAVTGRGKYLKRLDIKGRGRCGIIKKGHAFMRFVLEIPDERKELAKLLKVKHFPREQKPAYVKLDY